jgi:hypothetical protein
VAACKEYSLLLPYSPLGYPMPYAPEVRSSMSPNQMRGARVSLYDLMKTSHKKVKTLPRQASANRRTWVHCAWKVLVVDQRMRQTVNHSN